MSEEEQEFTMPCPKCRKIYISSMMDGCPLCGFKWGDEA